MEDKHLKFSFDILIFPLLFVVVMWFVYFIEITFGYDFSGFGIYPRSLKGLRGIFFSPFIHSSLKHLYNNTLPFLILSIALFYFYRKINIKVFLLGWFLSGILTWLIGRTSYHIGASGIIYFLVSFILFKGLIAKNFRLIALSLVVVFIYGSMFWYIFPIAEERISWEGHLSGFITGVILAFSFKKNVLKAKKYIWEKDDYNEDNDPFLKHFDENGNFISTSEMEEKETKKD
ncbi:rhomboid family intramembrane serine protease [Abyssalbus ytuae]|uniref:Rhomboid family intramembrane serine protease n=1 Tax=Abyssalbus ytuae TaxID=2926907 RepID=A0A9E6ZYT8_9FLAO|nr:rhomboid family intramembrane serine protease [Abyssalbus ytuae]UOB16371.1 rhomboid family intramembrane serine protease [Abyssalbus ytuae]